MNEKTLFEDIALAAALVPTMRRFEENGIWRVEGYGLVQMDATAFHKAFDSWFVTDREDEYVEHHTTAYGVDFFALVLKEENNG